MKKVVEGAHCIRTSCIYGMLCLRAYSLAKPIGDVLNPGRYGCAEQGMSGWPFFSSTELVNSRALDWYGWGLSILNSYCILLCVVRIFVQSKNRWVASTISFNNISDTISAIPPSRKGLRYVLIPAQLLELKLWDCFCWLIVTGITLVIS